VAGLKGDKLHKLPWCTENLCKHQAVQTNCKAIDEISADEDKSRSDIMRTLIRKAIWKKKSVIKRPYFDGHCEPEKASRATSHLIHWPS